LVSLCSSYTIQLPHDPQVGLNNKNNASKWLCSLYSRKRTTDQRVVFCVVTCAMAYTFLFKNIFIHIFRSR
jgi:hypothetical protein